MNRKVIKDVLFALALWSDTDLLGRSDDVSVASVMVYIKIVWSCPRQRKNLLIKQNIVVKRKELIMQVAKGAKILAFVLL
jgi:hypothetical protein